MPPLYHFAFATKKLLGNLTLSQNIAEGDRACSLAWAATELERGVS